MISEQMKAEGWIEHDGGPCPVAMDSMVFVCLSDGDCLRGLADDWDWGREYHPMSAPYIIAYKPEGHPNDQ